MTLTGKQKSFLRSLAMKKKPLFQIGKEGITDTLLQSVEDYLIKNELVKVALLDTCPMSLNEAADFFAETGIHVVQTIGKVVVLYQHNPKLENGIVLPEAGPRR